MAIDRRELLQSAAAGLLLAPLRWIEARATGAAQARFVSAATFRDGRNSVVVLDGNGAIARTIPLDARGHDIALSPDRRLAVAFARRPGTFAVAFDIDGRSPAQVFTSPHDRHFFGHGVFSPDGRLLYATENDFDNARGVIGVYDVGAAFQRIGEFDSHGIEPHDLLLMQDGVTLCIANGGIETHPDAGRAKLNLDSMRTSLVFVDRRSGHLVARHELSPELRHLSLRHLGLDAHGAVWFGGQWEGVVDQSPFLIGRVTPDTPIRFVEAKGVEGVSLKGYVGSVTASADRRVIAASSPRAGRVLYFDPERAMLIGESALADCCGIAPAGIHTQDIVVSSGPGVIERCAASGEVAMKSSVPGLSFDNHLRLVSG